jgi:hypothetical protein
MPQFSAVIPQYCVWPNGQVGTKKAARTLEMHHAR